MTDLHDLCQMCTDPALAPADPDFAERRREAEGWHEFHSLVDEVPLERAYQPGAVDGERSVRDLVGHVGGWLAEGGAELERIAAGSHRPGEVDLDATDARVDRLSEDLDLPTAMIQATAARSRLLAAWQQLDEVSDPARWWFRKVGSAHYDTHLPPLRAFLERIG